MDIKKLHSIYLDSKGVITDSRKIRKEQLFFALKGENFNGNSYAQKALDDGASYAIIDEEDFASDERFIFVENALACLQELAKYHRNYLGIPILAITGTNGKTTTKELIGSILQKKYNLGITHGNLNNHIGVPLTLLSFTKDTEISVVEMGANHIKEIAKLCNITNPDYGIITNIGKAHIEGFGSFEGVIKAKSELYDYLRTKGGKIFINGEDKLLLKQSEGLDKITYGKQDEVNFNARFIAASPFLELEWNSYHIKTNLVGEYNFNNVLAAISIGSYFDVSNDEIVLALSGYQPKNNRSQLTKTDKNTLIIDAYNANPTSMDLAVRNFLNVNDENKALILGDMFELGEASHEEHKKIIELVNKLKFENVLFVGEYFFDLRKSYSQFGFFINTETLCKYISHNEFINKTILLKASRGIKLEKVIDYL